MLKVLSASEEMNNLTFHFEIRLIKSYNILANYLFLTDLSQVQYLININNKFNFTVRSSGFMLVMFNLGTSFKTLFYYAFIYIDIIVNNLNKF
jgi:hypothetical protein